MAVIKRIGVLSLAKIQSLVMATIGLVVGIIVTVVSLVASAAHAGDGFPFFLGPLAIIALPVFYGIIGFVIGTVTAAVYNLSAKWIGGVEIELKK